jgi:hypothetical protein
MTADRQAEYAQRIAMILNAGDPRTRSGLEAQGPFKVDVLDLLDALEGGGLKLVVDELAEVPEASVALLEVRRQRR